MLSIVVPLYKSRKQVRRQIQSWVKTTPHEIIYVDDCCPQQSYQVINEAWKKKPFRVPYRIIRSKRNLGFGQACNLGAIRASHNEHLLFLNADTMVQAGWLEPLFNLIESDRFVGVVGNCQLLNDTNIILSLGSEWDGVAFRHIGFTLHNGKRLQQPYTLSTLPDELKKPQQVQMVNACCLLIHRALFVYLNGFDRGYRIGYWEDADLCMRVRELGFKIMVHPDSVIRHFPGHAGKWQHEFVDDNARLFRSRWIDK